MSIVKIENVRVLDPIQKTDSVQTVYIQDGKLVAPVEQVEQTIDGQGKWLMPTMVDLCARLREPGQQQHGTLKSEGKAARANGILHVITPPDSKPIVQDNGALIHGLIEKRCVWFNSWAIATTQGRGDLSNIKCYPTNENELRRTSETLPRTRRS